jgi:hypothetical protein
MEINLYREFKLRSTSLSIDRAKSSRQRTKGARPDLFPQSVLSAQSHKEVLRIWVTNVYLPDLYLVLSEAQNNLAPQLSAL